MTFASDTTRREIIGGSRVNAVSVTEYCTIAGEVFPRQAVEDIITLIQGATPVALQSPPGFGKSFFALHALKPVLEEIYPVEFDVIYSVPFKVKSPSDLFCRPSLTDNSMVWEDTWPIRKIREAQDQGRAIVFIVEEFTRMPAAHQNQFLDLLDSQRIYVEQTGDVVEMPAYSKVVLLGNPSGVGVAQVVEALSSRIITYDWPFAKADTVARMIINWADKQIKPLSNASTSFGFNLVQRELNFTVCLAICEIAQTLNEVKKEPVSLREIKKCVELWIHSKTDKQAVERMFHSVLARGIETNDDYRLKNSLATARNALLDKLSR